MKKKKGYRVFWRAHVRVVPRVDVARRVAPSFRFSGFGFQGLEVARCVAPSFQVSVFVFLLGHRV